MNTITAIQKTTELHNGVKMPWLGLGTYLSEPGEVEDAVKTALQVGYRSIDTAAFYRNELNIGKAIKESDVNRDEIFLTSKVWNSDQGYDKTLQAFDKSLEQLGTEYLDLYLVHWPVKGKFLDTWKALEKLYEEKRVRAIGVSNFLVHHLEELMGKAKIIPMVNQVEFHPYLVQKDLMLFCLENNIQQEAWSPIMKGRADEVELLRKLAEKYKKTPTQIVLRWDLQHNVVTIPKSVHDNRIEENSQIFDFTLTEDEMASIDMLDKHDRFGPDPDHVTF
ncbi:MAG TPA: aldo/keto reductase [Balneolales bacterium]|nr:aldo/keto reductase [Balneolales bacterium]